MDGTTTDHGAGTFATFDYPHHIQPECTLKKDTHDGVTCAPGTQIRRLAIYGATPKSLFSGMALKVLKFDDGLFSAMDDTTY